MEGEREFAVRLRQPDGPIGERRIADHQVVAWCQLRLGEFLRPNGAVGVVQSRDSGGDGVGFDAGEVAGAGDRLGLKRDEEAGAAAGFEDAPTGEAEGWSPRSSGRGPGIQA